MIRGIIEVPPKLVKPILAKAKKSWNNVLIMLLHPHPDKAQHGTADHQHQITDGRKQADAESSEAEPDRNFILEGLFAQGDSRTADDGHHGTLDPLEGRKDPVIVLDEVIMAVTTVITTTAGTHSPTAERMPPSGPANW